MTLLPFEWNQLELILCNVLIFYPFSGENRSNEFAINVNRFGKIPAINDNGFKLAESVAIFHYLGRKGIIPERWYPKDLRARTRIDEYLEWNQFNLFPGAGMYFMLSVLEPMRTGEKPNMDQVEQQKRTLIRALNDLENLWLKDKKYLTGDEVTFADLMAICSLEQVVGLQIFQLDDQRHANIKNWMERVKAYFGPTYQKAHAYLYKFGEVLKQNKK